MRITWVTMGLLLSSVDIIQCNISDQDFVLSVPQVLKHDLTTDGHDTRDMIVTRDRHG